VKFDFASGRILFGRGRLAEAGPAAREFGARALVVTGRDPSRAGPLLEKLSAAGVSPTVHAQAGEPTVASVREAAAAARASGAELVIGFGGGSALDAAKAAAALAANPGDVLDYLEVVGAGRRLERPALPVLAVPTTAGTGAEATRNAVIASPEQRVKASLRDASILPRLALVDPDLTMACPTEVTAWSGLDALTQLAESFLTPRASPLTDGFCREGLGRAAGALRRAWSDGSDAAARESMSLASLLSGLALANAGLGAVHGIAGPFGGMFPGAPHGAVCARLLPAVLEANARALAARGADSARFDELARLLTGRESARAADAAGFCGQLCAELGVPGLAAWGFSEECFAELAEKAARASSMRGNPVALGRPEIEAIFRTAL
jgi:alcohol dehydrogenase class IV